MGKRLAISIGDQKIYPFKIGIDHIIDRVAACPANTDNGDTRTQFLHGLWDCEVDSHDNLLLAIGG